MTSARSGAITTAVPLLLLTSLLTTGKVGAQIEFGPGRRVDGRMNYRSVSVVDMNADGLNDLLVGTRTGVSTFLNAGGGVFNAGQPAFTVSRGTDGLAHGHLDQDLEPDLVWVSEAHEPQYHYFRWRLSSTGHISSLDYLSDKLATVDLADFDRDGDLDAVTVDRAHYRHIASYVRLFENQDAEFVQVKQYRLPFNACMDACVQDFNRDGWPDLALCGILADLDEWGWSIFGGGVVIYLNNRTGGLNRVAEYPLVLEFRHIPERIAAGDLDGDGDFDIALGILSESGLPGPRLALFANDGSGRHFEVRPEIQLPGYGGQIQLADFDTDGLLDIVIAPEELLFLRNLGDLEFVPDSQQEPWEFGGYLAVGDLTGNGQIDLATVNSVYGVGWNENITAYPSPLLLLSPLVRGGPASFRVFGARPGELVYFLLSLEGEGNSAGQTLLGGMTLDLLHRIQFVGSARADESGRATLRITIPPDAPAGTATVQAVIRRGTSGDASVKTPFQTAPVLD